MASKLLLASVFFVLAFQAKAQVVSETLILLQQDGRNYLQHRTIRSHRNQYDFFVEKSIVKDDFLYIDPLEYSWQENSENLSQLHFDSGSFSVTYSGIFKENVTVDKDGIFTFNSWDQKKRDNGHYGQWNVPENFSRFVYSWVFPQNMEIVGYSSNREGRWTEKSNNLSLMIEDDNDITITLRYREKDSDKDSVIDRLDRCPGTPEGLTVDGMGCEADDDKDGVVNSLDQCLSTIDTARVDQVGCEIDSDKDGIPDRLDSCIGTKLNVMVNSKGCELDSDLDGVINRFDRCLNTKRHALVDQKGCELDFDGDGVVNSKDKCANTLKDAEVDFKGCVQDQDKDGVFDSKDECPVTLKAVEVDKSGCELDSDKDGVVNSADKCPQTADNAEVDFFGCEIEADTDADGVIDSQDSCANAIENAIVDKNGCELDIDKDRVVDRMDICMDSTVGEEVGVTGCAKRMPIVLRGVSFESASATLTPVSTQILQQVAAKLHYHESLKLEVGGHTDSQGSADYNQKLSQSRAEAVLRKLASHGVDDELLIAKGYGESLPVADNKTPDGRAQNRRVELKRQAE